MRRASASLVLWTATLVTACASGTGLDGGRVGPDAGPPMDFGPVDAGPPCEPACVAGDVCVGGHCYSPTSDADSDGVPTTMDCDDSNPDIGRLAERSCASACGPGVEQCNDGAWMPCSAPAACACHDGDPPRMLACGTMCGMQMQICSGGAWVNSGACSGEGECMAGMMGSGTACGMCGTQTRVCDATCHWSAFTCEGEGVCVGGAIQMDSAPCGACGTMTRTRTCSATTCTWGAYTAFGGCAGAGACTPGASRACPDGDSCGHEVCNSSCNWGGCTSTGTCLRQPAGGGPEGSNWRCCGTHGYQFCCPSCDWCGCAMPAPASYGC